MNLLTPNDDYSIRTAPLTSKRCILCIYSTNTGTEYFKHCINCPFFPLQNAVCFINLTYSVPVLFTSYIEGVLKLKKNNSGAKSLTFWRRNYFFLILAHPLNMEPVRWPVFIRDLQCVVCEVATNYVIAMNLRSQRAISLFVCSSNIRVEQTATDSVSGREPIKSQCRHASQLPQQSCLH